MTSLVVRRIVPVGCRVISEGVVVKERVQVTCPACRQRVEAVASDGQVKGYCTVARQSVDFLIQTQLENEYRAKLSAASKKLWQKAEYRAKLSAATKKLWQNPEYRARQIVAARAGMTRRWQAPEFRAKMTAPRKRPRPTVEDLP